jgi:DNA-binding NtrC family response regulator
LADRLRCPLCGGHLRLEAVEPAAEPPPHLVKPADQVLREHVLLTLRLHHGLKDETARALGVSRSTLRRWLDRWAVRNEPDEGEP